MVVEGVPVADPELDEPERPVMWNGYEYWKMDVLESRVITKPYVAKLGTVVGIAQVYCPTLFSIPARSLLAGLFRIWK